MFYFWSCPLLMHGELYISIIHMESSLREISHRSLNSWSYCQIHYSESISCGLYWGRSCNSPQGMKVTNRTQDTKQCTSEIWNHTAGLLKLLFLTKCLVAGCVCLSFQSPACGHRICRWFKKQNNKSVSVFCFCRWRALQPTHNVVERVKRPKSGSLNRLKKSFLHAYNRIFILINVHMCRLSGYKWYHW